MRRLKERGPAPPPPDGSTVDVDVDVDVFITTYNEPVDMVMATAVAARHIRYRHEMWVLDDRARPEVREAPQAAGIGYLTRSEDWIGRPRHAKAGNLNNARLRTSGEFMMILDADKLPDPAILDKTLGWFRDDEVALVQTPQHFTNVPEADPLGARRRCSTGRSSRARTAGTPSTATSCWRAGTLQVRLKGSVPTGGGACLALFPTWIRARTPAMGNELVRAPPRRRRQSQNPAGSGLGRWGCRWPVESHLPASRSSASGPSRSASRTKVRPWSLLRSQRPGRTAHGRPDSRLWRGNVGAGDVLVLLPRGDGP